MRPQRGNPSSQFLQGLSIFGDTRSLRVQGVRVQSDGHRTPAGTPPDSTRGRSAFIVHIRKATARGWGTASRYCHPVGHSDFVNCRLIIVGLEGQLRYLVMHNASIHLKCRFIIILTCCMSICMSILNVNVWEIYRKYLGKMLLVVFFGWWVLIFVLSFVECFIRRTIFLSPEKKCNSHIQK